MFFIKKIKQLEARVEALEKGMTVKTFRYGDIDLKRLARMVERLENPPAATDGHGTERSIT